MVLKMEFPSKFWFTVLPPEKGAKPKVYGHLKGYTAAINGIGELEKNQLRVYINKVFVPKEPERRRKPKPKKKKLLNSSILNLYPKGLRGFWGKIKYIPHLK